MTLKRLFANIALLCLSVFVTQVTFAQNKVITGKVTDSRDGSGLSGVSVTVKGSRTGTQTGADGSFQLTVPSAANVVVVSYVGFESQEISIEGKSTVDVSLAGSNAGLNEVVVVGYGTARRKDLTGAISSVQAKDFNQGIIASPDQLLQNKVPGVEITNNSGQPGVATTIKIRGNNSIRAVNNPLYVIDGIPLDGRSARPSISLGANGLGFGSTPEANPLLYINPNDIQSIDILKDASSAAIYGSRGANGVIVLTTKKGTSGPTKLEAGISLGIAAGYMKRFEVLDAAKFREAIQKYSVAANLDGGQDVDALKEITQSKLSQNYSLAFSGGNEVGKFRASFLGSRTAGFLKGSNLDKYLGSFNGQYKFLDNKLSIDFGLIAGHVTELIPNLSNNPGSTGNLMSSALSWNPTMAFKDAAGLFVFPANGSGNPMALLKGITDIANVNTFLGNISAGYKILNNLDYKFMYAINHSTGERNTNLYGWLQGYPGLSGSGYAAKSYAKLASQTFTHTLNYRANLTPDFTLEALAGFEYWKSDFSNISFAARGFNTNLTQTNILSIPYTNILQNGNTIFPPGTSVTPTTELQSYFARASFNYLSKYYITGTIRADGSSKFGENNKYGYFPSFGARWVLSNESFLEDNNLFSNLAIRGSWGITGNQEFPAGASQEQFSFTAFNNAGQANVANPDLKWESTQSYNIGIDYGLLNGKIFGSIDYYHKNTTDILFQSTAIQPAPSSIYFINLPADLINEGVEFAIGATLVDKENFGWDANFNIAYNKNILKNFFAPGSKTTPLTIVTGGIHGQGVSGTLAQIITNDQPVNEFFLKPFMGFDPVTGNQIIGPDPVFSGDPNPHTLYGISTTLRYKKLRLTINGGGAGGFYVYNNTATSVTNLAGIATGRNVDLAAFNSAEGKSSGVSASARFLEKGNYFKLRNMSLNYSLGTIGNYVKSLNVFVNATNLFIITKFTGFDPEVNIDKTANDYPSRSIEFVPYPTPRIISFGFNLSL